MSSCGGIVSSKSKNKTEVGAISVSEQAQRLALFGPPLLLEGENAAAYDDFLIRIRAAVNPVDIVLLISGDPL